MRALCLSLALLAGCASSTGTGGPRILDGGKQEVALGVDLTFPSVRITPSTPVAGIWPQIGASYRRGFGRGFEAGARTWGFGWPKLLMTIGGAVDAKYGIIQSGEKRGFDLSVGAGVGYHQINAGGAPTHVIVTQVPLLFGFDVGKDHQIYFGPRFEDHYFTATDVNPVNIAFVGSTVGFSWQVSRWLILRPEAVGLWSPVPFNGTQDANGRTGFGILQFGLSASVRPDKFRRPKKQ